VCQKRKVTLIVRVAYRLPETGIVECLKIIDVGCNLKQFDGLTRKPWGDGGTRPQEFGVRDANV